MDQITTQILSQVNCNTNNGIDCFYCLRSSKLQAASLIGTTVNKNEFERVSLVVFCYLLDLNQFCLVNSVPDYQRCYNYLTNFTDSIGQSAMDGYLKRLSIIYKVPNYYYPSNLKDVDSYCIESDRFISKYGSNNSITGADALNAQFSEIIFMMYNRMKIGCKLPYSNYFIDKLYTIYDSLNDNLSLLGFKKLLSDLSFSSEQKSNVARMMKSFKIVLFNSPTSTTSPTTTTTSSTRNFLQAQTAQLQLPSILTEKVRVTIPLRAKRDASWNSTDEYDKCYNADEIMEIYTLSGSISKFDFHTLCPSLLYMKVKNLCVTEAAAQNTTRSTDAEKYGYGTIAIFIVSSLALLGVVLLPCFKKKIYEKFLQLLTALAVGTLFSDAMLHILPEILGAEQETNKGEDQDDAIVVPDFAVKVIGAMLALYIFWLLETLVHHFAHVQPIQRYGHSHGLNTDNGEDDDEGGNTDSQTKIQSSNSTNNNSKVTQLNMSKFKNPNEYNLSNLHNQSENESKCSCFNLRKVRATGWMILAGDAIHNFADGMAVGASFSQSVKLGVSTTIAVVCHEVPHELGNYAVLIKSGFTHFQALVFNLLSALTCFVGFYVGASVSTDPEVSLWIFTVTAGMFIYISLVDLLPTVMSSHKWSWKMFIASNIAMVSGFIIMFLLVIFEDHIKI